MGNTCSFYLLDFKTPCLESSPGCVGRLEPSRDMKGFLGARGSPRHCEEKQPPRAVISHLRRHPLYLGLPYRTVSSQRAGPSVRATQMFDVCRLLPRTRAHPPAQPPNTAPGAAAAPRTRHDSHLSSVPGPSRSIPCGSLRVAQHGRWSLAPDEAPLHSPPATCLSTHSLPDSWRVAPEPLVRGGRCGKALRLLSQGQGRPF